MAAQRLLACIREGDLAARLGGDEFAVMICGVDQERATAIARRMVDVLHEPFTVGGPPAHAWAPASGSRTAPSTGPPTT